MSSAQKPIIFRAVHDTTRWRKARHETLLNARTIGKRSARALFQHENDAIDYGKHGEPRYVIIWNENATSGEVIKPDPSVDRGLRAAQVAIEDIQRWEQAGGVSDEELERYFHQTISTKQSPTAVAQSHSLPDIPESAEQLEEQLQAGIRESMALSQDARRKRLKSALGKPRQIQVKTSAFLRNPDVIVEVLERAKGYCEICGNPAPFLRASNGSLYLEVHHILPLACGGEDTVANAQALCPNCHRRVHFGINAT
jgi:hypothetical protein